MLGWARSPFGLDHAVIHFGNGRVSIPQQLDPRTDVTLALPWYPDPDKVSFGARLSGPPQGIYGETDMQIEIVDRRGHSTLFRPSFFKWLPKLPVPCEWREDRLDELLQRLGSDAMKHRVRLLNGTESIRDVIDPLVGDADYETDLAFAERAVSALMGSSSPRLTNWCVETLARGRPRERVLDDIVTSRDFAAEYLRAGAVTVD